jgi:hypothetical protein
MNISSIENLPFIVSNSIMPAHGEVTLDDFWEHLAGRGSGRPHHRSVSHDASICQRPLWRRGINFNSLQARNKAGNRCNSVRAAVPAVSTMADY